jgi:PHP family Zn ribbon phosphoesterase
MIPPLIVQAAQEKGINLIAITDHNATANIAAVQKAAAGMELVVLPGMEVQTREEVHSLCLFDTLEQAAAWQALVDAALPPMHNRPDFFGEQFVVDQAGDFIRREERLLAISTSMSLEEAFHAVSGLGGLFIPAHVDRRTFGLLANLGLVPTDIVLEALEISRLLPAEDAAKKFPQLCGYPLIQSGDVHRLDEFLGTTFLTLQAATVAEIRLALQSKEGRELRISGGMSTVQ